MQDQITVQALQAKWQAKEDFLLLDVRSAEEFNHCNLGGSLIPLPELMAQIEELPKNKPILVLCRSGKRSQAAVILLKEAGFSAVKNISGGILAWAKEIDPSFPTY
jgi:rhodanese-related sulfurtransferase